jgi:hypothetical protein
VVSPSKKIPPPPPPPPRRGGPPPPPRGGGGGGGGLHTCRAVRRWGVNILEDSRHRIGLLQYDLSAFFDPYLFQRTGVGSLPSIGYSRQVAEALMKEEEDRIGPWSFLYVYYFSMPNVGLATKAGNTSTIFGMMAHCKKKLVTSRLGTGNR